ncbi:hypothetical protein SDC9_115527 [bioreactor metagenome]|uniref:Uncharacterized protein n=1 Tax=bioreactor metagenome TaxID=1076179 RepID=A0A645BZR4_9ZZZZ
MRYQGQALEADQVAVCLGCTHAGAGREVLEHERPAGARQGVEQREAHFHRLYAQAFLVHLHCERVHALK